MVYLIFGKNTFSSQKKLKEIISERKEFFKENLDIFEFSGKDMSFDNFKKEYLNESMFRQKQIFILRYVFSNQRFKEEFLKEKRFFKKDKIIIFFEEDIKDRSKDPLYKMIKKNGQIYEFKKPGLGEVRKFIKGELSRMGYGMDLRALNKFINFVGEDLWRISYELKKLMTYKYGEKEIEEKDVILLVKPKIDINIFKTIDAIADKNKKKALEYVYGHLEKGDPPLYILTMITYQFRNLLIIKEKVESLKGNVNLVQLQKMFPEIKPFVVMKSFRQSKKFSLERLKRIYRKIFQVNLSIKVGKLKPEEALELLILDI